MLKTIFHGNNRSLDIQGFSEKSKIILYYILHITSINYIRSKTKKLKLAIHFDLISKNHRK